MQVELRNIDLTGITKEEQLSKVKEEILELNEAIELGTDEEVIEETLDAVQSILGLIQVTRNITVYEVMEQYDKHLEKLKHRPRIKGIEHVQNCCNG